MSIPPDLDEAVESAAKAAGSTYSAWVTETLRKELKIRAGLAAVAEFEAENGAFTNEERAQAHAWALDALARSRRSGEPLQQPA